MTIEYINTGTIANDGTGDALREAFIKINNNFEELDLAVVQPLTIENIGEIGVGVFAGLNDGVAEFKRIVAGTNVTINENDTRITIDVDDALSELLIISDNGSIVVQDGQSLNIVGGNGLSTSTNGQTLNIELDTSNILSRDGSPTLGATLNAAGNDIDNIGTARANTFIGSFEGLLWGYDFSNLGTFTTGFDFGSFRTSYQNSLEFLLANTDIDFGPVDPERGDITVDLGFLS